VIDVFLACRSDPGYRAEHTSGKESWIRSEKATVVGQIQRADDDMGLELSASSLMLAMPYPN
jgi:hypothetical protein